MRNVRRGSRHGPLLRWQRKPGSPEPVLRPRSARELHAVWTALGAPAASEEARMAALAAARAAAQGSCAAPAHELLALAAREADLLSRRDLD